MLEPCFTPFPEIITDRLLLSRVTLQDAADILALRSSEIVMKYIDKERSQTIADAEEFIGRVETGLTNNDGITWRMSLKENTNQLIGNVGLWRIIKPHYRAEIGYMLHPDYWGKGLMLEALNAVIDFGFNNIKLHSIEAHINPSNAASAGILLKTGFVQEAYFKEDYFFRGKFSDTVIYSLLNKK